MEKVHWTRRAVYALSFRAEGIFDGYTPRKVYATRTTIIFLPSFRCLAICSSTGGRSDGLCEKRLRRITICLSLLEGAAHCSSSFFTLSQNTHPFLLAIIGTPASGHPVAPSMSKLTESPPH